jgi:hypothetical protein
MTTPEAKIFAAVKNGTLLENLPSFDNEQIKLLLPTLMLSAFPSGSKFSPQLVDFCMILSNDSKISFFLCL